MSKLKCWKKQPYHRYFGNNWWEHIETGATVSVSSKTHGVYHIFTPVSRMKRMTKEDAMKYAQKYMEGHDTC